ncbi:MAG: biopolymer transporter ExbD [Gemmatimonadota bacterium]
MNLRDAGTRFDPAPTPSFDAASKINVTPLIDVLLVLLIIFMVTAGFSRRTIPIQLPPSQAHGEIFHQVVLELTAAGLYRVNGQVVPPDELPEFLGAIFRNRSPGILFIKTAPEREYQEFIHAADIARGAGVTMVAEMGVR